MALATRCPNCQALFRVVADQLKLRGGLVRCGACRHVFDAIGSLTYIEDSSPSTGTASTTIEKAAAPLTLRITPRSPDARPVAAPPGRETPSGRSEETAPAKSARTDRPKESIEDLIAESSVPTLLAPGADAIGRSTAPRETAGAAPDEAPAADADEDAERRAREQRRRRRALRRAARAEQAEPAEQADAQLEAEPGPVQPDFLRAGERGARSGFSVVFGGGSLLLLVLLLAQLAAIFRVELATRWPQLRPALVQVCGVFGCTVGWPARAELLAVVGTELQAIPGTDVLELTAVVRNRASFKLALPAIEVTLTDTQNRALARKVFAPVDYLASAGEPSSRIDEGLAAGSDYTIRIAFEARGLNATGFVVYPFYL